MKTSIKKVKSTKCIKLDNLKYNRPLYTFGLILVLCFVNNVDFIHAQDNLKENTQNLTNITKKDGSIIKGHINGEIVLSSEFLTSTDTSFKYCYIGIKVNGSYISSINKAGVKIIDNSPVLILFINANDTNEYSIKNCLIRRELLLLMGSNVSGIGLSGKDKKGKVAFKEIYITQKTVDKKIYLLGEFRDGELIPSLQIDIKGTKTDLPVSDIVSK
jgi:hypothetical protein